MKIHIVQKGDTLWEIAKKYGVDFEELKQLNSQLASPDMIMPGMKIRIPSTTKTVKKEMHMKEKQHPIAKTPFKEMPQKPMPVIKEEEKEKIKKVKAEMPMPQMPMPVMPMPVMPMPAMPPMMQMPIMEQEMTNYTTINLPPTPHIEVKKEMPKEKVIIKEIIKPEAMPTPPPMPQPLPEYFPPPMPQPLPENFPPPMPQPIIEYCPPPMLQPVHMVPLCCHVMHPCFPPIPFTVMANMVEPMPYVDHFYPHEMCPPEVFGAHMEYMEPSMEMPVKPMESVMKEDCGCGGQMDYPIDPMGFHTPPYGYENQYMVGGEPMPMQTQMPMPMTQHYPPMPRFEHNYYPTPPGYTMPQQEGEEPAGE